MSGFIGHPNSFLSIKGIIDGPSLSPESLKNLWLPEVVELEIAAAPGKLLDVADAVAVDPGWVEWTAVLLRRFTDTYGSCVYQVTLAPRPLGKKIPFSMHPGCSYVSDGGLYPPPQQFGSHEHVDHPELRLGYGKPMVFPAAAAFVIRELLEVLET